MKHKSITTLVVCLRQNKTRSIHVFRRSRKFTARVTLKWTLHSPQGRSPWKSYSFNGFGESGMDEAIRQRIQSKVFFIVLTHQWYLESWCHRWGRLEWYRQWLQRQMWWRSWEAPWGRAWTSTRWENVKLCNQNMNHNRSKILYEAWTSTRWESSSLILMAIPSSGSFYTSRILMAIPSGSFCKFRIRNVVVFEI